jgi:phytoene/squalene synthetase
VKGHVYLEQVQPSVDGVDQTDLSGQGVDDADAAVREATGAVSDLIMDVAGREHGLAAVAELSFVQAPFDAALAVDKLLPYLSVHSKSLLASGSKTTRYSLRPRKRRRISSSS